MIGAEGTGVFLVMDEEPCSPLRVPVPAGLRLVDVNPVNGLPYFRSPWRELPDFAAWVVVGPLNIEAGAWDLEVADGTVDEVAELDRVYSLAGWKRA